MTIFSWHNGKVPQGMEIKQVYGVLFDDGGRILLMKDGDRYSLAGGTPENFDLDIEATLRRELIEEINTTIEKPILLGYQSVDEEDKSPIYAQVRMVALIDKIGEAKPDIDNGKTYERVLVTPVKAIELLSWGDTGKALINDAVILFKQKLKL